MYYKLSFIIQMLAVSLIIVALISCSSSHATSSSSSSPSEKLTSSATGSQQQVSNAATGGAAEISVSKSNEANQLESTSGSDASAVDSTLALESETQQQVVAPPSQSSAASGTKSQSSKSQGKSGPASASSDTLADASSYGSALKAAMPAPQQVAGAVASSEAQAKHQQQADSASAQSGYEYVGVQPEEATPELVAKLKADSSAYSASERSSLGALLDQIDQQESSMYQYGQAMKSGSAPSYNNNNNQYQTMLQQNNNQYQQQDGSRANSYHHQQQQQQPPRPMHYRQAQSYNNNGYGGGAKMASPKSRQASNYNNPMHASKPNNHNVYTHGPISYPVQAPPPRPQYTSAKLTGLPLGPYPYPAPGHPHMSPRHLPRGAAAGYAAFRKFVRAHAQRYRQISNSADQQPPYRGAIMMSQYDAMPDNYGSAPGPAAGDTSYAGANSAAVAPNTQGYHHQHQARQQQQDNYGGGGGGGPSGDDGGYRSDRTQNNNHAYNKEKSSSAKVSTTQAFIPHHLPGINAGGADSGYGGSTTSSVATSGYQALLSSLYGAEGGKHGYTEFGKVVYYPHATVYTEPMSPEQLYKLTGTGIHQILDQLQYSIANGGHDASNTIRDGHKGHHIGNGITIHAKEYHAPTANGGYASTTAAVIRGPARHPAGPTNSDTNQQYGGQHGGATNKGAYDSGANDGGANYSGVKAQKTGYTGANNGYSMVKQAAAADETNGKYAGTIIHNKANGAGGYATAEQQQRAPNDEYNHKSKSYQPLATSSSLSTGGGFNIDELLALYQANGAFVKNHLSANVLTQLGQYNTPDHLKMKDMKHKVPTFHIDNQQAHHHQQQQQQQQQQQHYQMPQAIMMQKQQQHYNQNSLPMQYIGNSQQSAGKQSEGYRNGRDYGQNDEHNNNNNNNQYQIQQQMQKVLHELAIGDDQYNRKAPIMAHNQGYPHHLLAAQHQQGYQKQQQQQQHQKQQQQQNQQQQQGYNPDQLIELPHSPNDQVGEIADLIEALKGTLESHGQSSQSAYGQQQAVSDTSGEKLEDVQYLMSTLKQTPSYAVSIPIEHSHQASQASGYQSSSTGAAAPAAQSNGHQTGAYAVQQQQQQQQQTQASYGQQQQTGAYNGQAQSSATGYGQQQQQQASPADQQQDYQPLASFVESLPQAYQELMQQAAVVHAGQGGQALTISHDVVLHQPQQQQYQQQTGAPATSASGSYQQAEAAVLSAQSAVAGAGQTY